MTSYHMSTGCNCYTPSIGPELLGSGLCNAAIQSTVAVVVCIIKPKIEEEAY